jgi:hypothetical protein
MKIEGKSIRERISASGKGPTLGIIQKVGAEFKMPVIAIKTPTITAI